MTEYKKSLCEKIICADGFSMSVQANSTAYCHPRTTGADRYDSVEVGFPSEREEILMPFAEDNSTPTKTVYGWVPSNTVALVCAKHGGVVSGELPAGVAHLTAQNESR